MVLVKVRASFLIMGCYSGGGGGGGGGGGVGQFGCCSNISATYIACRG